MREQDCLTFQGELLGAAVEVEDRSFLGQQVGGGWDVITTAPVSGYLKEGTTRCDDAIQSI